MGPYDWHVDEVVSGVMVSEVSCCEEYSDPLSEVRAALLSRFGGASLMYPPVVWRLGVTVRLVVVVSD